MTSRTSLGQKSFSLLVGAWLAALLNLIAGIFVARVLGPAAVGSLSFSLGLSGLANEAAVAFRAGDLDPQLARYASDQGEAAFANGRVALGSFAVCCGWVIASTRFLPRWLGWLAIASGAGLALTRISWTGQIWLLPYLIFSLWVITVALLLLRRNFRRVARSG